MATIEVRLATKADVPTIVELNDGLFQEDARQRDPTVNLDWAKQYGAAYFAKLIDEAENDCFVAQAGATIIGYLAARSHAPTDYRMVASAELESIFVRVPWRSQQAGAQLVQAFIGWAYARGAQRLTVNAFVANERAIAFYRRAGFTPHSLTLELRKPE